MATWFMLHYILCTQISTRYICFFDYNTYFCNINQHISQNYADRYNT